MMLFLVTGHGRSGTNYMAKLFQYLGYDVGAQQERKDGQSHNYPAGGWPPSKLMGSYKYLIHVVRNPWMVVESTYLAEYSLPDQYFMKMPEIYIDKGKKDKKVKIEEAVSSIVLWNRAIRDSKPDLTVKVEDAVTVLRSWLDGLGLVVNIKDGETEPRTDVNARHSDGWDMEGSVDWASVPEDLMNELKEHCRAYGYDDTVPVGGQ